MKTIKIIDLLNKIANDEDIPEKIKYNNKIWNYKEGIMEYISNDTFYALNNFELDELNDEVEILEEPKGIPEKLKDILKVDDLIPPVDENMYKIWKQTIKNQNKINEILNYLESKGE